MTKFRIQERLGQIGVFLDERDEPLFELLSMTLDQQRTYAGERFLANRNFIGNSEKKLSAIPDTDAMQTGNC